MIQVPPSAQMLLLSDATNGATVDVSPGQTVEVRLSARPDTGYAWQLVQGAPGVVVVRQGYGPAPGPYRSTPMGRPGQQVFDLRAAGPSGRTVALALAYKPTGHRMAFARVWRVRLRIGPAQGAASLPGQRR
jgi:predicted secreted protein